MDKKEIINEFVENYRAVCHEDVNSMIGYVEAINDDSVTSVCAAVLTILNHLKED